MKKYQNFLSENFHLLVVKFSVYLNRHVFVMFHFRFPTLIKQEIKLYVTIYGEGARLRLVQYASIQIEFITK